MTMHDNGRILCGLEESGTEIRMTEVLEGATPTELGRSHLSTYRGTGAVAIDTRIGIIICGGMDKEGYAIGKCELLILPTHHQGSQGNSAAKVVDMKRNMRARAFHNAVCVGTDFMYTIGGRRTQAGSVGWTDIMNFQTYQWKPGPDLNIARHEFCAVVLQNRWIVVLGGLTGSTTGQIVKEVEILDTIASEPAWRIVGTMDRPRRDFSAVVDGTRNVYIFGGGIAAVDRMSFSYTEEKSDPTNPTPSAPMKHASLILDGDEKPAAVVDTHTFNNTTSTININVDNLFPEPPTLPSVRKSSTVVDRATALTDWATETEILRDKFVSHSLKTSDQVKEAFDTARDLKLKQLEHKSSEWVNDTQRLIDWARKDAEKSLVTLKNTSGFMSSFLSRTDRDDYDDNVPSQLRCPITLNLMVDPVVASDGITYERASLEAWLDNEKTSPLTGAVLESKTIFPNLAIKSLCDDFVQERKKE